MDGEHIDIEFPDENLIFVIGATKDVWKMYFNGAVNASKNKIGAVLTSLDGKQFSIAVQLQFECTNNMTEYKACIFSLQTSLNQRIRKLKVFGDFVLIIFQTKGNWRTKDPKLIPFQKTLTKLIKNFQEIEFNHLSRKKNPFADPLATLASMVTYESNALIQPLTIEVNDEHVCGSVETKDSLPWY